MPAVPVNAPTDSSCHSFVWPGGNRSRTSEKNPTALAAAMAQWPCVS